MNKWLELLIGLVLIIVPILIVNLVPVFYNWGHAAIEFLKGGIVVLLVMLGIIFVILWISDLKS